MVGGGRAKHSDFSIWINNISYRPNASPLHRIKDKG